MKIWMAKKTGVMPLISLMAIIANTIWFFVLAPLQAFVWATLFHGIQYLAIIIIFHVKDQTARPENRHNAVYHVVSFYLLCLCLAYALFQCVPMAYRLIGFGSAESVLRLTPRAFAAAVTLRPRGSRHKSRSTSPGCGGLCMSIAGSLLMIVLIIHGHRVGALEQKRHTPVPADRDGPLTRTVNAKWV